MPNPTRIQSNQNENQKLLESDFFGRTQPEYGFLINIRRTTVSNLKYFEQLDMKNIKMKFQSPRSAESRLYSKEYFEQRSDSAKADSRFDTRSAAHGRPQALVVRPPIPRANLAYPDLKEGKMWVIENQRRSDTIQLYAFNGLKLVQMKPERRLEADQRRDGGSCENRQLWQVGGRSAGQDW
ncbi:Hypothetical_protein [Hexamita inflata]|uniref:Hypothetical_protein n=1 Tax=Hexamita inflata TaxID=28002 RepID=A0AA86QX91_9EUKA|nr:Hypothetical protein HINF_LOCUS53915 [Hexamita inflata]